VVCLIRSLPLQADSPLSDDYHSCQTTGFVLYPKDLVTGKTAANVTGMFITINAGVLKDIMEKAKLSES